MNENLTSIREQFPELLTVKEVQQILRIGRNSVYTLMHAQAFPVLRVGKSLRIPREPFLKWMEQTYIAVF